MAECHAVLGDWTKALLIPSNKFEEEDLSSVEEALECLDN